MRYILATFFVLLFTGCASVMYGPEQYLNIASKPEKAEILVDGQLVGETPSVIRLSSKELHTITIRREGYVPKTIELSQEINPWFWGNFATILPLGMLVDVYTGSMYRITDTDISVVLPGLDVWNTDNDGIYIFLTDGAVDGEPVAELRREGE